MRMGFWQLAQKKKDQKRSVVKDLFISCFGNFILSPRSRVLCLKSKVQVEIKFIIEKVNNIICYKNVKSACLLLLDV